MGEREDIYKEILKMRDNIMLINWNLWILFGFWCNKNIDWLFVILRYFVRKVLYFV